MSSSDEFDDEKKYIMEWDAVDCVEEIEKDGNCLFRCLALSALGQVAKHPKVRDDIATELKENEEVWKKNRNVYNEAGTFELTQDITKTSYADYVHHVSQNKASGDIGCLYVAASIYGLDFKIWSYLDKRDPVFAALRTAGVSSFNCESVLHLVKDNMGELDQLVSPVWTGYNNPINVVYSNNHFNALENIRYEHFSSFDDIVHTLEGANGDRLRQRTSDAASSRLANVMGEWESRNLPVPKPLTQHQSAALANSPNYIDYITRVRVSGSKKRRKKRTRLSNQDAAKLLSYQCKDTSPAHSEMCEYVSCAATGVAYKAQEAVWGTEESGETTVSSRTVFMLEELRAALTIKDGEPVYRHKVGNFIVCHDAWRILYGFPQSSVRRAEIKIETEQKALALQNGAGVSLNSRRNDVSDVAPHPEGIPALTCVAYLSLYRDENCDRMPIAFVRKLVIEEQKQKLVAGHTKKRFTKHKRAMQALEAKLRRREEEGEFDYLEDKDKREMAILERLKVEEQSFSQILQIFLHKALFLHF